jgi:hypothetical protein
VGWLGGLFIGLVVVSSTILLWPERGPALVTGDENPSQVVHVLVDFIATPMLFVAGVGAVISLVVRFRRARGDERQQIKWFASAAALTLVWIIVFGQASLRGLPEAIVALSALLVIPSIPIATGIAILRYRLYDIDVIINRTLVYGSLTAVLAAVYLGSVVLLQYIFRALTGQGSTFAVVASTVVIAALFNPLRRRIQRFIDRRFYRRKYDAAKTLEAFSDARPSPGERRGGGGHRTPRIAGARDRRLAGSMGRCHTVTNPPYSPECVEGVFCEVPLSGLPLGPSNRMAGVQSGL